MKSKYSALSTIVGMSRTARSLESVVCPAAWKERRATGHRSRKLVKVSTVSLLPDEKEPGTKGWLETRSNVTRSAGMAMRSVCMEKEAMKMKRRREDGCSESPVGKRCSALKNSVPRQKDPIAVRDL